MTRKILLALGALLCFTAAWALLQRERDVPLPVIASVPEFQLTERSGSTITLQDLKGRIWIADFIFTSCAGTCPDMTAKMKALQSNLAGYPDVSLVSISVDPKRDTPAVLSDYADRTGADQQRWLFLTGDEDQIRNLARKGFLLAVEADSGPEPILHSQKFVLVDRQGQIRGYYDSESPESGELLMADLRRLLREPA